MIKIKNKNLKYEIEGIIDKNWESIKEQDLNNIEAITINGKTNSEEIFEDLNLFKNLTILTLKNCKITKNNYTNINGLKKIKEIQFSNCTFEKNINLEISVEKMNFISCNNLKVGKIIKKSNINNLLFQDCSKLKLYCINDIKSITLDSMQINNELINNLSKFIANDIIINNCEFTYWARIKINKIKKIKKTNIKFII